MSPRTHPDFAREAEMVQALRSWLKEQNLFWKEEYRTPWGICDFVGVAFASQQVEKRLSLGQRTPIGPLGRIALLDQIPEMEAGRTISFEELTRRLRAALTQDELRQHLDRLVRARFVAENEQGAFWKVNGWVPLHSRIVTIELKLRRIRDVFYQAQANLRLASESYVGLPRAIALHVANSARKHEFEEAGLGLLSVGRRNCRILIFPKPRNEGADRVIQMHCVERFWRTWLRGN